MRAFAASRDIPFQTFGAYACEDKSKRRKLGTRTGPKSLLSDRQSEVLCQVAIRHDRANEGLTIANLKKKMTQLKPGMSLAQAKNHLCSFFKKHLGRLKSRAVKAQSTTAKRSQCNVAQQYRWLQTRDRAYNFLLEKNTGKCRVTGKTFREVMHHFVIGADETNLMCDQHLTIKFVGEFGRKKHEKRGGSCRASATMLRTGNATGDNGPTVFVMA